MIATIRKRRIYTEGKGQKEKIKGKSKKKKKKEKKNNCTGMISSTSFAQGGKASSTLPSELNRH